MRAAIYARKSTEAQAESTATQVANAKAYIAAMGWTLDDRHLFIDDAISRAEYQKRPALYSMLNGAERDEFDVIVMRDVDRLGGDQNRNGVILSDLFDRGKGVHEYATRNVVKLDDAISKFLNTARSFAAEVEREKVAQRTHEALQTKAAKGFNVGGKAFGYSNHRVVDGDRHLRTEYRIHPEEARVVRDIFSMFVSGMGYRGIAHELNAKGVPSPRAGSRGTGSWAPSAVRTIIVNDRYRGLLRYGRFKKGYRAGTKVRTRRDASEVLVVEKPDLRIISDDVWLAAQKRLSARKPWERTTGPKPRFLLTGLATCSACGGRIKVRSGKWGAKPVPMYGCGYHRERGAAVCANALCRPVEELDEKVLQAVSDAVLQEKFAQRIFAEVRRRVAKQSSTRGGDVERLEKQSRKLQTEISNLAKGVAMATGSLPALVQHMTERQAELDKLRAQLQVMQAAPGVLDVEVRRLEKDVRQRIADLKGVLQRNPKRAREALEGLLDGKMVFEPVQRPEGRRYEVTGKLAAGGLLKLGAADVRLKASLRG
jgi:site-specific DNA recombinase